MDMKKILAAVNKADNKTKTSSTDMKKFLSIITESNNRLSKNVSCFKKYLSFSFTIRVM